ncbi:MAG: glutamine synthetase family protein [Suipraeoptans sp.]
MKKHTKEEISTLIEEEDVAFIRLQFTDAFGSLKNMAITPGQLEKALNNEICFDGYSIANYAMMEEAEMFLHPDINTFEIFPWRPQQGKVARFLCDVCKADGTPFELDPRDVLKKAIKDAASMGYEFMVKPDCEFFLFEVDENGLPTTNSNENASYFDLGPQDRGENTRRDMVLTLEEMGFETEGSYHEKAPAQHEIKFKEGKSMDMADDIVTFRMVIKTIAKRHGRNATFMPKPIEGKHGSGMHTAMYLLKDGANVFSSDDDANGLSKEAYHFIGGILKHIRAITFITNPTVNSYKRLVSGYEAPTYISWSASNSNSLIRIPMDRKKNTRIKLTSPDSSANPYLALAVCLRAGLDGIKNQIEPPKAVDKSISKMSDEDIRGEGIEALPLNLMEALRAFEEDDFVKQTLGEMFSDALISEKRKEYNEYAKSISEWEVNRYLHRI